ncbi:hypothetical protein F5Y19DRAFT_481708 [Xylariaceae sp. FL1651]|nr:hypothetical protein F5Y19DRAFT_481708 [Xylariaceae sp. FL1651]
MATDPVDDAKKWIDTADYIPKNIGYDWLPLCTALVESFRDVSYRFSPSSEQQIGATASQSPQPHVLHEVAAPGLVPSKSPSSGSWKHVQYIPSWMDPDYKEDLIVQQDGRHLQNTVRDSIFNLRPALRINDVIRNPTDYAQRFGVAADRLDGRSRMSPTWSQTRNPFDDFANQVNLLNSAERKEAEQLSLEIYYASGKRPAPGEEILPQVMQTLLSKYGVLTNTELVTELRNAANNGMSLDQMVEDLERRNPNINKAHQGFLKNAQQDQDYQRMLLLDLTTDELIQNNIHTMSNAVDMDLEHPIHFLFRRDRWDNSKWKGAHPWSPKYVYNINGVREEWDVASNDSLWDALQPALRLVSKVIDSYHPHLEAILNMNTRQPIAPHLDQRTDPTTPSMTKYVLEEDIDMDETYDEIRELHDVHGYDWKTNVLRLLYNCLILDIGSCYARTGYSAQYISGVHTTDLTYGFTQTTENGPSAWITLRIGAELIWPLLVPQYSKSEKMACSFLIASTLLHEFAHAICNAQELLTKHDWAHPPGQDPAVTKLIRSLDSQLWDYNCFQGEPFFEDAPEAEVGHEFEKALWGFSAATLTGCIEAQGFPIHLESLSVALAAAPVPFRITGDSLPRKNTMRPTEIYHRPVSIDFVEKTFSQRFWKEDHAIYGHSALHQVPKGRVQKTLLRPGNIRYRIANSVFGENRYKFLTAVPNILYNSRQYVLAMYLESLTDEVMMRAQVLWRWSREVDAWSNDVIHPLQNSVDLLNDEFQESVVTNTHQNASHQDKLQLHQEYLSKLDPDEVPMAYAEWEQEVNRQWQTTFSDGGFIMQRLLDVHKHMQTEIGILQRMVFEFLSFQPANRALYYRGPGSSDNRPIDAVYARLTSFLNTARGVAQTIAHIAAIPELIDIRGKWEEWRAQFESNALQYHNLLWAVGQSDQLQPNDSGWKTYFKTVPSANWRRASQRYEKQAMREYNRVPPVVRKVIDEYLGHINQHQSSNITLQSQADIVDIQNMLKALPNYDAANKQPVKTTPTIFDFKVPTLPLAPSASRVGIPTTTATQPLGTAQTGVMFGVSGAPGAMKLGATPPRRASTAHIASTGRRQSGSRVHKPRADSRRSSGFERYVTNPLAWSSGSSAKTTDDLTKCGVPQPVIDNFLRKQVNQPQHQGQNFVVPPVGQHPMGVQSSLSVPQTAPWVPTAQPPPPNQTPIAYGPPILPFPNPYASRIVLTSEAKAFDEQKKLQSQTSQSTGTASGVFTTTRMWRERVDKDDDIPSP